MNTEHMGLFIKYQNFELRRLMCVYYLYTIHAQQFTHLKCTIQWFSV